MMRDNYGNGSTRFLCECPSCGRVGRARWTLAENIVSCPECGERYDYRPNTYAPVWGHDIDAYERDRSRRGNAYKRDHPEKRREYDARYRERNREKLREYNARYYKEHREELRERHREWFQRMKADPERYADYLARNRDNGKRYRLSRALERLWL